MEKEMSKLSQMFKFGYRKAMEQKNGGSGSRSRKRGGAKKPRYLGPSYVGGSFYDTNYRKPVKISESTLQTIRKEYGTMNGKRRSDAAAVDAYLTHMRRKFGNWKDDKFIGMYGDK